MSLVCSLSTLAARLTGCAGKSVRAGLVLALLCAPLSAGADAVSDAMAAARQVKAYSDAAAAQIPVAQAALQQTRAAASQVLTAMRKALAASSDADNAKGRADAARVDAEKQAAAAATARAAAQAAAAAGDCAAARAAAAAAASAATAADQDVDTAAASLQAVKKDAVTADQAKADALNAVHRANAAAAAAVAAYGAADKAAAAASDALAAAYGEALTMSKVGKSTSEGSVKVTEANYNIFQDAVASAQSANSSASTVAQIRQYAIDSYDAADQNTQNTFNAAKHIQADTGAVIDAKNAAARAARRADADAAAAKAAADGCKAKVEPPQTPPPPPPPPKSEPRTYRNASHRGTCEPCQAAAKALNDAVDAYNALPPGPNGTANPAKDAALAKVRDLSDALTACERQCVAPTAQNRAGSAQDGSVLSGSVLQGIGVATPAGQQPNRGAEDSNSSGSARTPPPGRPNAP